ncbi:hypothetical protein [Acinetobacter bereziniae]|uniref:hypothetical protein n=1 Tax=Acinetobacter bereziniae TaxID=106648 RepID=UPI000EF7511C|nr:hypothetical protein [Acinetobacter bereziniae]
MEINKEREAFEAWYEQHHNGRQIACDYVEEDNSYSVGYANAIWVGWQAAKATPEGFVLVPNDTIMSIYDTCDKALDSDIAYRSALLNIKNDVAQYADSIEAQEQSHD